MVQVTFKNSANPDVFLALIELLNVSLPLRPSAVECGVLVDENDRDVLTIDVNRERSDTEVLALSVYLCMAINSRGGFDASSAVADLEDDNDAADLLSLVTIVETETLAARKAGA